MGMYQNLNIVEVQPVDHQKTLFGEMQMVVSTIFIVSNDAYTE